MNLAKLAADATQTDLKDKVYNILRKDYPADCLSWVKKAEWALKDIPLSEINMARRPGGRNMEKVRAIAKAINNGEKMGPVFLVVQSDGSYQIADGYHRTLGFKHAGKQKIKAYVANTGVDDGPWDEEMHAKKLNVAPGKTASEDLGGLAKLARQILESGKPLKSDPRVQQVIKMQKSKDFLAGQKALHNVRGGTVKAHSKDIAMLLGRNLSKMAGEFIDLRYAELNKQARDDALPGIFQQLWEESLYKQSSAADSRSREELLKGLGKKKDKKGWYLCTHRARSKSYPSIDDIPLSVVRFIESTS